MKNYLHPTECFGIHIHFPECKVGENENVFIGALKARTEDSPILDDLKKAILKHFPDLEGQTKIVRYQDLKTKQRLFFCDGYFLNEQGYPMVSEKKAKIYMSVAKAA